MEQYVTLGEALAFSFGFFIAIAYWIFAVMVNP